MRFYFLVPLFLVSTESSFALTNSNFIQQEPLFQQSNHGGVGLIQTPSARFNPDGDLSLNYSDASEYRYWSVSLELFPWMETTMRYLDTRTQLYSNSPDFSGYQTHKDKGIDTKFKLWTESQYFPQIALGFRDFGGTGIFSSEFISFAKRFGDFDTHIGLGFGYLGRRDNIPNPFCKLGERFCSRPEGFSGTGGEVEFGDFFKGKSSLFGGITYQTPWSPLSLVVEFDPNDYKKDFAGALRQDSPWNYGAYFKFSDQLSLRLSYQRGNTFGFGASYRFNFNTLSQIKYVKPAPQIPEVSVNSSLKLNRERLANQLYATSGFLLTRLQATPSSIRIVGVSKHYRDQDEFIERVGRVLALECPATTKEFIIVEEGSGIPLVETKIDAASFRAAATLQEPGLKVSDSFKRIEPSKSDGPWQINIDDSGFYTSLSTYWLQSFGSPESFYMYQGGVLAGIGYNLNSNWTFHSTTRIVVLTNFDDFKFKVDAIDTGVPRVRTYVREYVSGHDVSLDNLFVSWKDQLSEQWYGAAYAGLLEQMFTGAGIELLNRKVDRNFAYGVDLNYVAQRDFSEPFAVRDYRTWTGHLNFYWQPEFLDDVLLKIKAGRYLAKDNGVTFEMNRRFDSGIVVGAYATKTNLSAAEYGEGSFTKGFFVSVPFDLFVLKPAKGQGKFPWVPISRDGGQPLQRPVDLYELTDIKAPFSR